MSAPAELFAVLHCHPETRCRVIDGIESCFHVDQPAVFTVTYMLKGNVGRLQIPPAKLPRTADRLWQHTCFEAFFAMKDSSAYCEFNLSPSSEWAAYTFGNYRDGGLIEDDGLDPKIVLRKESDRLELSAVIYLDRLPLIKPGAALRLGLSAVIEDVDGQLSYWALKHPAGKPDFHHPDSFALEVSLPG
jgi:hypothetical protein